MKTSFIAVLALSFAAVCLSSGIESCPQSKVCSLQGVVTQACYHTDTQSMRISSWINEKELYTLNLEDVKEASTFLNSCPEVLKGNNFTLKYESNLYALQKRLIEEEEATFTMLSYSNLLHKNKFDESMEKVRAEKQVLMAEVMQFQRKLGL